MDYVKNGGVDREGRGGLCEGERSGYEEGGVNIEEGGVDMRREGWIM